MTQEQPTNTVGCYDIKELKKMRNATIEFSMRKVGFCMCMTHTGFFVAQK